MAPEVRLTMNELPDKIKAAVLIMLFPKDTNLYTVFIKRNTDASPHSGQVSFPGGKFEPEDLTLKQTALRECQEEIGIVKKALAPEGKVFVHGELWNARAKSPIDKDVKVRIVQVINLVLEVEAVDQDALDRN